LNRAIDSVLNQNYPKEKIEVVVVDDGSTDNTPEILKGYGKKIKVVRHKRNMGLPTACNTGLKNSSGEYIIRLDADDTFPSAAIQKMAGALDKNKEVGFVYGDYYVINSSTKKKRKVSLRKFDIFKMVAANIMFRRKCFEKIGFYNKKMFFEEYDILIRIMKKFKGAYVAFSVLNYYRHGKNMTNDKKNWDAGVEQLKKKYSDLIFPGSKIATPQYVYKFKFQCGS